MAREEVKIDLSNTEIREFGLEREGEGAQQVTFSVEGMVYGVDEQVIEDAMLSSLVRPLSISLEIEKPDSGE